MCGSLCGSGTTPASFSKHPLPGAAIPPAASRGRKGASRRWAGPRTRELPPHLPCPLCLPRPPDLTHLWADQSKKQSLRPSPHAALSK